MARPERVKVMTSVYLRPEQDRALRALHERTRVPVSEYIRQGVDLVLAMDASSNRPPAQFHSWDRWGRCRRCKVLVDNGAGLPCEG